MSVPVHWSLRVEAVLAVEAVQRSQFPFAMSCRRKLKYRPAAQIVHTPAAAPAGRDPKKGPSVVNGQRTRAVLSECIDHLEPPLPARIRRHLKDEPAAGLPGSPINVPRAIRNQIHDRIPPAEASRKRVQRLLCPPRLRMHKFENRAMVIGPCPRGSAV